ncbi:alpha/beta fold hydrolase [Noviherbaspirillum galbum]|uniref:Alpha/beta hydrolase n=1 Tax=Noviherbaspirillum galbum TaxID=2709383 RepID=A0A6B3STT4_9BURK|nr:alpha/beta hydrolase [Noviherbaspirillum galbum]NEX64147.1 alpha/beta hydrolase [Noviherbaspirillum galbum]
MSITIKHNISLGGSGTTPMVFGHGFGCNQVMWRHIAPAFHASHRVVLFDYVGAGGSDMSCYDPSRYDSLQPYADDVCSMLRALGMRDAVFVGHSVSCMIGALAAIAAPELISRLVMIGPSARYIDDGAYVGGFTRQDIDNLIAFLDDNYLAWARTMAPVITGRQEGSAQSDELADSFCRTDPAIARQFARVTFLGDNRADLPRVPVPTLVMQCAQDAIAPEAVGKYVHQALPDSRYVRLEAIGHCPHLSAPQETIAAIAAFLGEQ